MTTMRSVFLGCLVFPIFISAASAQPFKPDEVIEYKASGFPEIWERGKIIKELPGGTQYLVRQKPTQFFPEGFERAYPLNDIRRPQTAAPATTPAPAPTAKAPTPPPPQQPAKAAPPATTPAQPAPVALPTARGLLDKEQVITYARAAMGANPWANPNRDALLAQIREHIKQHGTRFTADDDFRARMNEQGTMSSHIGWAVDSNHGPAPKLTDYIGRYQLTAANRGSQSYERSGSRVKVTTTDSQAKSGQLEIKADGTYVWDLKGGDPPEQWLRGKWREVRPDENQPWEAGPAIWLERAKQGYDCMVRMGRQPGWPGWIEVGMGKARSPVEYGKKL
ncbi:MAG: hypothetical protein AB1705_22310 [Verrucomicrobiota bacterium]